MKKMMLIIGLLVFAMGLLWIGQGKGYIQWPASSFMISQVQWVYYGSGAAVVGLIMIIFSRR